MQSQRYIPCCDLWGNETFLDDGGGKWKRGGCNAVAGRAHVLHVGSIRIIDKSGYPV